MTSCLFSIGGPGNLFGPDMLVVAGVLLGALLLIVFLVRRFRPGGTTQARLRQLDAMRGAGTITDIEYQQQRQRILTDL